MVLEPSSLTSFLLNLLIFLQQEEHRLCVFDRTRVIAAPLSNQSFISVGRQGLNKYHCLNFLKKE